MALRERLSDNRSAKIQNIFTVFSENFIKAFTGSNGFVAPADENGVIPARLPRLSQR